MIALVGSPDIIVRKKTDADVRTVANQNGGQFKSSTTGDGPTEGTSEMDLESIFLLRIFHDSFAARLH